jgi:hypothetical protein
LDHEAVARHAPQSLADDALGFAARIERSRVNKVDPQLKRGADGGDGGDSVAHPVQAQQERCAQP